MKYQITLFQGDPIEVTEDQTRKINQEMQRGAKHIFLPNQTIAVGNIAKISEYDGKLDGGRWRCASGHIHPPTDTYCQSVSAPKNAPQLEAKNQMTPEQAEEAYKRGREKMAEIRKNLGKKWEVKK